jgi:hypothetical protein
VIALLVTLAAVPIGAAYWAKHHAPVHAAAITGAALGAVISPLSLGIYAAAFLLGPFGLPLVFVGLPSSIFHGTPGLRLARYLEVIPPGVVEGIGRLYVDSLSALVWIPAYAAAGWLIDRLRTHRRSRAL